MSESVEALEKELSDSIDLSKRTEKLKANMEGYFETRRQLLEAFDKLDSDFSKFVEEERKFLEELPKRIQTRIDNDRAVLEAKKALMTMLKE